MTESLRSAWRDVRVDLLGSDAATNVLPVIVGIDAVDIDGHLFWGSGELTTSSRRVGVVREDNEKRPFPHLATFDGLTDLDRSLICQTWLWPWADADQVILNSNTKGTGIALVVRCTDIHRSLLPYIPVTGSLQSFTLSFRQCALATIKKLLLPCGPVRS
jgi:hypothetical protein